MYGRSYRGEEKSVVYLTGVLYGNNVPGQTEEQDYVAEHAQYSECEETDELGLFEEGVVEADLSGC